MICQSLLTHLGDIRIWAGPAYTSIESEDSASSSDAVCSKSCSSSIILEASAISSVLLFTLILYDYMPDMLTFCCSVRDLFNLIVLISLKLIPQETF